FALDFFQELKSRPRGREIAVRIERERRPHRVAPEEPGEAGPLAVAGSAEARDQSGAEQRTGREALINPDLRPGESLVQPLIGRNHAQSFSLQPPVISHIVFVKRPRVASQLVISLPRS